ncbi:MAG TPA: hypothetical protein VFZ89_01215 [Solirubrobacteraceae bacterium]
MAEQEARVPYAVFGERFFEHAVTAERVARGVAGIAGDPIAFGPIGAGPGKIAQVSATGVVGEARVERLPADEVAFRLSIPVKLDLEIDLGVDSHTFHALVTVNLTLTARAAEPLRVVIDIDDPTWEDIDVELEAETLRGGLLQRVAGIDREIGRFVARYVRRELDKPRIRAARDIDVAARIDGAWRG